MLAVSIRNGIQLGKTPFLDPFRTNFGDPDLVQVEHPYAKIVNQPHIKGSHSRPIHYH